MPMSVLSRLLPPPTYLTMPCVGLDVSDTSLKYISFAPAGRQKKERKLKLWGDIPIPNGVVQRGQVMEPNQLVEVLKEFRAETEVEFVRVSLPEERAYLFETEIKRTTPAREVRGLLEFRLEENVPIPSREVFFDYTVLPSGEDKRSVQIAVAAYAKETIMQYYEACIAAGLHPISFEIEAQAMARAVVPRDIAGSVMLVDFGKTRTGIGIVHKGALLYTSTIDIGGDQLSRALRKVVGEDAAEATLTDLKNNQGLIRGVESTEIYEAVLSAVSVIKDEIATRMQYWHLRNGNSDERRINSALLCGGSVNLKGLPAYLTEALGVPSVRGNVWENAFSLEHTVPPIERRYSFGYATAIGLALRDTA
jgi:type IV pilus assembly protein PilM